MVLSHNVTHYDTQSWRFKIQTCHKRDKEGGLESVQDAYVWTPSKTIIVPLKKRLSAIFKYIFCYYNNHDQTVVYNNMLYITNALKFLNPYCL